MRYSINTVINHVTRAAADCPLAQSCSPLQLNTIRNESVEFVLANSKCYLKELTLHYYPYYKPKDIHYDLLLGEDLMREAVRNVSTHLALAAKYNQTLRISEANSQSGMWRLCSLADAPK